jgi:hypothetical protein
VDFWTKRTLPWDDMTKFFTRVLGASLHPKDGSIRSFEFFNGKRMVLHEPHRAAKRDLGPHTLQLLRDWLERNLGFSHHSFFLKV